MKKERKSIYSLKIEDLAEKIPDIVLCIFMKRLLAEFVVRAGIRNILPSGDFVVGSVSDTHLTLPTIYSV